MAERWRKVPASRLYRVPGGVFEASSEGRVRKGSDVLEGSPDPDGYLRVGHGRRKFFVHVLVILAWQGEPQVRHLGESNQSNKPAELAWGSVRENRRDREKTEEKEKGQVSPPSQRLQPVTGDLLR